MKLDEMARDAADALHVSVAHLEPPHIDEKPRLGRLGLAALARVAVVVLIAALGVTWWLTSDSSDEVVAGSGGSAEIPKLGVLAAQWRPTLPVELPLPEILAERLPDGLIGADEGVAVVYEDRAGSGAFLTLVTEAGDLDGRRDDVEQAGATTTDVTVSGAAGFSAAHNTRTDEAGVREVTWAPDEGVVASLTLTGFDTSGTDLVELAESAELLDDQTWTALQEVTGWAAAIRSATGDFDTPLVSDDVDPAELAPGAQVVIALGGLDRDSLEVTAEPSASAAWRSLAPSSELDAVAGRTYAWQSGSLRVLLAVADDDQAAEAADALLSSSDSDEISGAEADGIDSATAYRRAGRLLVRVEIDGWPEGRAEESASAIVAAIIDAAGDRHAG